MAKNTKAVRKASANAVDPEAMASLKHWGELPHTPDVERMATEVVVECGWGRLIFGQSFDDPEKLADKLLEERRGQRDVALYVREPHVVLSYAPQDLFLDPSNTYRLVFKNHPVKKPGLRGFTIRKADQPGDEEQINRIFMARNMVPVTEGFYWEHRDVKHLSLLVAEEENSGRILGTVTGVDHRLSFDDPDNGSSLWALAVDPQAGVPGVGRALVQYLAYSFQENGRGFMDLSVMHDNEHAIALYEKLGFVQVPVYCLKNKNSINERLFIGPTPEEQLNIYAKIIVDEARRRGISVNILDAENGYFRLSLGGRSVTCRESLSELTTAIAMSRCDDKAVTRKILANEGLRVPDQAVYVDKDQVEEFLRKNKRVVVKPARGEQGHGISVDLTTTSEVLDAIEEAKKFSEKVLLEEYGEGEDLRIIVIDYKVVAAAIRKPAQVVGDGEHTVRELIEKQSRRREAATGGESKIPMDSETHRCVNVAGHEMDDVLKNGETLNVRKTANLHTGGTIHDVTDQLNSSLIDAAIRATHALDIPLVGLDFLVPDVRKKDYVIIEANERPGLANHEPQPTAERFIDLLFPRTKMPGTPVKQK